MKDLDLAYYAGLFDGEGCVQISYSKPKKEGWSGQHTLQCTIAMIDEDCVKSLLIFGGSVCLKRQGNGNRQTQWRWNISSNQAKIFLITLLPHLRLKHKQAKIAIKFQESRIQPQRNQKVSRLEMDKRDWYQQKLKDLKVTRGKW